MMENDFIQEFKDQLKNMDSLVVRVQPKKMRSIICYKDGTLLVRCIVRHSEFGLELARKRTPALWIDVLKQQVLLSFNREEVLNNEV